MPADHTEGALVQSAETRAMHRLSDWIWWYVNDAFNSQYRFDMTDEQDRIAIIKIMLLALEAEPLDGGPDAH